MSLRQRVESVQERIRAAVRRAGRDPAQIELIAVSKTHPVEFVRLVAAQGVRSFGENRVQEAAGKVPEAAELHWHFIGRLQRNKARKAVALFELIHSVDSLRLAETLDRLGCEREEPVRGLIEVKLGGESSKGGVEPAALLPLLERLAGFEGLRIEGLMTIPPPANAPEAQRPAFRRLAELAREVKASRIEGVAMRHLSMGMSSDFEVAIEEGATLVRIGTALFGPRRPWPPSSG